MMPTPRLAARLFWTAALVLVAPTGCRKPTGPMTTAEGSGAVGGAAGAPASTARRIVSVGGSVTETIFALGGGERVVGVDLSSTFPADAVADLPRVGYLRALSAEGILSLRPDLVIAPEGMGPPQIAEQLRSAGVRVEIVVGDSSPTGARSKIAEIARLLGLSPAAAPVIAALDADLDRAARLVAERTGRPKVLFIYSRGAGAVFVGGRDTPADTMIGLGGGQNAAAAFTGFRPITAEAVVQAAPEVVLMPTAGLESLGGPEGLWQLPGLALTPAGRARRVVTVDDGRLLGFGPRVGQAALELAAAFALGETRLSKADPGAP